MVDCSNSALVNSVREQTDVGYLLDRQSELLDASTRLVHYCEVHVDRLAVHIPLRERRSCILHVYCIVCRGLYIYYRVSGERKRVAE